MHVYCLSRFNLYIREFRERAGLDETNMASWLRGRVELFQRYTLPSMLAQSEKPDAWLIGFDSEITEPVERLIDSLRAYDFIKPIIHNNRPSKDGSFPARVTEMLRSDGPVATTRLDTDDCLHRDFFAAVRRATVSAYPSALDFPHGAQLHDGKLYSTTYRRGPFITAIERPLQKTALGFAHYDVEKHMPLVTIETDEPYWLQVIHGGNVANALRADAVRKDFPPERFGLSSGFVGHLDEVVF